MQATRKKFPQLVTRALRLIGAQERSITARRAWRRLLNTICRRRFFLESATLYRKIGLRRVVFIGVTGSCGKTTTKELIAAVLASQLRGHKNPGNNNLSHSLAKSIVGIRPWHDFCALEIAAAIRGERIPLEGPLRLVRPQIGVVTNIESDHISAFGTLEAIAAEKGKLIAALPSHGTAVLNVDDPRVLAMQERCAGRVVTYGFGPEAMVRAENISSSWPARLSFTVRYAGQMHTVHTQLCGAHWVPCVLAALAVGIGLGVPLATAVQAVHKVPPFPRRMDLVQHPDGVTFIRDDYKAPLWSIPAALQFMREARAQQKVIVIGTISDFPTGSGNRNRVYATVARQALEVADHVVFVGPHARRVLRARRQPRDAALQAFHAVEAAYDYLRDLLQPGALVLLKDSNCERLGKIIEARMAGAARLWPAPIDGPKVLATGATSPMFAVVGIGNPGEQYQDTPHNVGQRTLDCLAEVLGGEWTQEEQALVAQVEWRGTVIYLVKPLTMVNATGSVLVSLAQRLGVEPATCLLVHDDADLALGSIRGRLHGSDGGHRGVRSILQAFCTDTIPRVKIGVGRPRRGEQLTGHVLAAFAPDERPVIDRACAEATDRVLSLIEEVKRSGAI